jgi:hypothetical protein
MARTIVIGIVCGMLFASALFAAPPTSDKSVPFSITASPIGIGAPHGVSASRYAIGFGLNNNWFTAAVSMVRGSHDIKSFLDDANWGTHYESHTDISLLYGRRLFAGEFGYVALNAGIGRASRRAHGTNRVFNNDYPPTYRMEEFTDPSTDTWSFPLDLQLFLQPVHLTDEEAHHSLTHPRIGIGLDLFFSYNKNTTFGGITLGLQLGN